MHHLLRHRPVTQPLQLDTQHVPLPTMRSRVHSLLQQQRLIAWPLVQHIRQQSLLFLQSQ
jgi:hypothetical protein